MPNSENLMKLKGTMFYDFLFLQGKEMKQSSAVLYNYGLHIIGGLIFDSLVGISSPVLVICTLVWISPSS